MHGVMGTVVMLCMVSRVLSSHRILCHRCCYCVAMVGIVLWSHLLHGCGGYHCAMLCCSWGCCMVTVGVVAPCCVGVAMGVTPCSVTVVVAALQGGVMVTVVTPHMVLLYCMVPHSQSLSSWLVVGPQ